MLNLVSTKMMKKYDFNYKQYVKQAEPGITDFPNCASALKPPASYKADKRD